MSQEDLFPYIESAKKLGEIYHLIEIGLINKEGKMEIYEEAFLLPAGQLEHMN